MSTAFASVADVIDAPLHWADHNELPFGAEVLSLQTRRDMRPAVEQIALENAPVYREVFEAKPKLAQEKIHQIRH